MNFDLFIRSFVRASIIHSFVGSSKKGSFACAITDLKTVIARLGNFATSLFTDASATIPAEMEANASKPLKPDRASNVCALNSGQDL